MTIREMPVMRCRGTRNWPPIWEAASNTAGLPKIEGEIGRLRDAFIDVSQKSRMYLFMEHAEVGYIAALDFDDDRFCPIFLTLLQKNFGATIEHIGGLDIGRELADSRTARSE